MILNRHPLFKSNEQKKLSKIFFLFNLYIILKEENQKSLAVRINRHSFLLFENFL